jgi:hypothetical protein
LLLTNGAGLKQTNANIIVTSDRGFNPFHTAVNMT